MHQETESFWCWLGQGLEISNVKLALGFEPFQRINRVTWESNTWEISDVFLEVRSTSVVSSPEAIFVLLVHGNKIRDLNWELDALVLGFFLNSFMIRLSCWVLENKLFGGRSCNTYDIIHEFVILISIVEWEIISKDPQEILSLIGISSILQAIDESGRILSQVTDLLGVWWGCRRLREIALNTYSARWVVVVDEVVSKETVTWGYSLSIDVLVAWMPHELHSLVLFSPVFLSVRHSCEEKSFIAHILEHLSRAHWVAEGINVPCDLWIYSKLPLQESMTRYDIFKPVLERGASFVTSDHASINEFPAAFFN